MLDPQAIHELVAITISEYVERAVNCYAFEPNTAQYPAAVVLADEPYITYHQTFGDNALCTMRLRVAVMVRATDTQDAHAVMADLLGAGVNRRSSVVDALEQKTDDGYVRLGGQVECCTVFAASRPTWEQIPPPPNQSESPGDRLVSYLQVGIQQRRGA